jgi:signal peptidase II
MPASAFSASRLKRSRRLVGSNLRSLRWPLVVVAAVILADQSTKLWAVSNLTEHTPVRVLGDFLMFSLVYNQGGAMGTRLGPSVYYLIMALIVLPVVLYYLYRNRQFPAISLPLAFIAGGAIGNLIDRIRLGQVIDFIDVDFFDISLGSFYLERWWTFNIADACISCSIVFLIAHMFIQRRDLDSASSAQGEPEPPADSAR